MYSFHCKKHTMSTLEMLTARVTRIEERNVRVEQSKAWETSVIRRVCIAVLTYAVVVIFFSVAQLPKPFLNALVPAGAFLISTLTLSLIRTWWIKKHL